MKGYVRGLLISILTILFFISSSMVAFAERSDVDSIAYVAKNQGELMRICTISNQVVGTEVLVYTGDDGMLSFSNSNYNKLIYQDRQDFMNKALQLIKESGMSNQVKNKAFNFVADQDSTMSATVKYLKSDASSDFATASVWFKPFGSFAGKVMGFLAIAIFSLLGLSILFDWAYIVIPIIRVILTKGDDSKKPFGVSMEAYKSVTEVEGSVDYKSVAKLYLGRRVPAIIAMSICLSYLISGKIYDIIVFFMNSFTIG